jgi:hypothetical protein
MVIRDKCKKGKEEDRIKAECCPPSFFSYPLLRAQSCEQ